MKETALSLLPSISPEVSIIMPLLNTSESTNLSGKLPALWTPAEADKRKMAGDDKMGIFLLPECG